MNILNLLSFMVQHLVIDQTQSVMGQYIMFYV
jgi:hypothetical protein